MDQPIDLKKALEWALKKLERKAPHPPSTPKQLPAQLSRGEVLDIIEENGGPGGVNFADCDLSGIDLHFKSVRTHLEAEGQSQPAWYSSTTHGMNLRGAGLQNADLAQAILVQADLSEATLHGANLQAADFQDSKLTDSFLVGVHAPQANFSYCDMRGCYLIGATLTGANLSNARLQGADLTGANLKDATLCNAKLTEVDLTHANLEGVNLAGAWLVGTFLTRRQIGDCIIQESKTYTNPDQETGTERLPGRYAQAASVYRGLKNNFLSIGSYDDASWAYVKERKMRKKTHWPPERVRESHPVEFSQLPAEGLNARWGRLKFYGKHLLAWALDWAFELTSAYGEKPSLTLWWALVSLLGFALLYRWVGGITEAHGFLDYANYSLGSFVTLSFNEFQAVTPLAKTLTSIEALLGICILALLMFALGNRINRS